MKNSNWNVDHFFFRLWINAIEYIERFEIYNFKQLLLNALSWYLVHIRILLSNLFQLQFSYKRLHKSNNLTNSLQKYIQIFLFILFSNEYKICFSFQQQQHDNHGLKNEWCKSISKQNKMSRKYLGMSWVGCWEKKIEKINEV